ncbi:hypothetical protein GIB67_040186, partial [Kingdonia uniflora]
IRLNREEVPLGGYNTENHPIEVCSQSKGKLHSRTGVIQRAGEDVSLICFPYPIIDHSNCIHSQQLVSELGYKLQW